MKQIITDLMKAGTIVAVVYAVTVAALKAAGVL